jgi:thiol-disulfide isomerase/thioredoxin
MTFLNRVKGVWSTARHGKTAASHRPLRLALIVFLAFVCQYAPGNVAGQEANQPVPDMTFRTYEDQTIRTGDLKDYVVLVYLWATDCKACVATRAAIERLDKQFAVQGVWFLSVNEDEKTRPWKNYLFRHPSPMTEVWDENHSFRRNTGTTKLPVVIIVGRGGQVRWRSRWTADAETKASAQLASLLQEPPPN